MSQESHEIDHDSRFFGQPRVLANLFGVELWERFSFYGMQGILLIYLYWSTAQGGLGISEATAAGIVGAYGGTVYLSTILGAWLADRVLGSERTLFYAAIIVMLGHIALGILPGLAGVGVGLVLVAIGSGGVKANATSLVGSLYAETDERRDAGFSIFYMGINIGGLFGPLLTGLAQKSWGFHAGFGLAAAGMLIGLIQYSMGRSALPEATHRIANPLLPEERRRYATWALAAVAAVVVLSLVGLITLDRLAGIVIAVIVVATVTYFVVILRDPAITGVERSRVKAALPLFACNAVFWSLYQQQFTVVTIYSDKRLNRDIFGWEMPVGWVQAINPVFIILLAGVFAALWTRLGPRQPSTPWKFGAGTLGMGLAFFLFLAMPSGEGSVPLIGLIFILLIFTISELLISPVGLSAATKLAPTRYTTQMVALYFLSVALGTAMAGELAGYYDPASEEPFFLWVGGFAILTGALVILFRKPIRMLMAGAP